MSESQDPDMMRKLVVERLVGATGEPDQVIATARGCAIRALPIVLDALKDQLSFGLDIELKTIEIIRVAEAKPAEDSGEVVSIVPSETSRDALTMQMDGQAVALFLNAYMGGDPEYPTPPIERELSAIEREVTRQVFDAFAHAINGKGVRAFGLRLPAASPVSGEDLRRLVVRDGPGVRTVFKVASPAGEGEVRALMPQRVLLQNRDPRAESADEAERRVEWKQRFNGEVMRSSLALEARIAISDMTLGDVAAFEVGKLIELPADARSNTKLVARGRPVFVCEFGKLGQNYTVRIGAPFDAGQEFMDSLLTR